MEPIYDGQNQNKNKSTIKNYNKHAEDDDEEEEECSSEEEKKQPSFM